jgi:hypothetical protein
VVVVKNDGSVVEGTLVKDIDKGVLIEVGGKTTLVPEADIAEVVEDCSRSVRGKTAPGAAPRAGQQVRDKEQRFRSEVIGTAQTAARWVGTGCLGLGCNILGAGVIAGISTFAYMLTRQDPENALFTALLSASLIGGVFGVAAIVFMGGGAGLLLGARLADFVRPDEDVAPLEASGDQTRRGSLSTQAEPPALAVRSATTTRPAQEDREDQSALTLSATRAQDVHASPQRY